MASTTEVFQDLLINPPSSPHGIMYNYLVPNIRGMENMVKLLGGDSGSSKASMDSGYPTPPPSPQAENAPEASQNTIEISLFAAATEAFSKANTNCSITESLERCKPIVALAKEHNLRPRGYVSVALGCPYEGPDVDPHVVAEITASLLEMGCDEVSIADTTGASCDLDL
jgi:hydroxymethylglutaryl-CoA lyase